MSQTLLTALSSIAGWIRLISKEYPVFEAWRLEWDIKKPRFISEALHPTVLVSR
jgi:hypothetical protein